LQYTVAELIKHLQLTIDSIMDSDDLAIIVLYGDFNQLRDDSMQAMELISVIDEPTHQGHKLDRIYTSQPLFINYKVVQSTINTAHKAIIARSDNAFITDSNKYKTVITYRKPTPKLNASFFTELAIV